MRTARLLGLAAEAESLRLRRQAAGLARGMAWYAAAALFAVAAIALLHAAAWMWIAARHDAVTAALALALVDALAMLVLLALGRQRPDPIAAEALRLRRQAWADLGRTSIVSEIGGLLAEYLARGLSR